MLLSDNFRDITWRERRDEHTSMNLNTAIPCSVRQASPPLRKSPSQNLSARETLLPREEAVLALPFPLGGLVLRSVCAIPDLLYRLENRGRCSETRDGLQCVKQAVSAE